ncbi:hypothetical protein [Methanobrevibacter sp.]|uniref:hypothetical protein n=1 Tax=Methanobrevibacter sp. TaxID=66852 RepID=UPI00386AFAE1
MNTIEFDDEHFVVSKEKDYGDPVGEFRVIRYDTGYYALQKKIIGLSDSSDLDWETIVIAPQLDTPLDNEYDWKFSQGNLTMNMLLQHLDNSSKLHNNELMELHLNLNTNLDEDVSEEIIEIIKSHDGKRVADKIIESVMLQDSYFKEHLDKSYRRNTIISSILLVICLTCFSLTILSIFGVL